MNRKNSGYGRKEDVEENEEKEGERLVSFSHTQKKETHKREKRETYQE